MTDRARVVVSVTASVDGRVTLGRDRLLLSEEAGSIWRSIWPTGADAAAAARTALLEELFAPTDPAVMPRPIACAERWTMSG
jgi:2,5-diamino-6-(ribosylamino)-4(3H)-pyrimidinone 5'-phosphate reductase